MKQVLVADFFFLDTERVKTFSFDLPQRAGKVDLRIYAEGTGGARGIAIVSCTYLNRKAVAYNKKRQPQYRPDAPATPFNYTLLDKKVGNKNNQTGSYFELGEVQEETNIKGTVMCPLGQVGETCKVQIIAKIYD